MLSWFAFFGLLLALWPPACRAEAVEATKAKVLFLGSPPKHFRSPTGAPLRFEPVSLGGQSFASLIEHADAWAERHPDATQIVIHAGGEELAKVRSAEQAAGSFQELAEKLHSGLPLAELHLVAARPALVAEDLAALDELNEQLELRARQLGYVSFIDPSTPMIGADGRPRRELFGRDQLHLSRRGHELWRDMVWPSVSRCEEQQAAEERLAGNSAEIYQLTSRTVVLQHVPAQARAVVGKAGALWKKACEGHAKVASAAGRAALLRKGKGQPGKLENGSALVLDTLTKIQALRDRIQKDYREAAAEARRFGSWGYNQATNAKGKPEEQSQLRREAFGGRRLAAQAAHALLSVDHELSRLASGLAGLGAELLERWEVLDPGAGLKLDAARASLEKQEAERERQDRNRIGLRQH